MGSLPLREVLLSQRAWMGAQLERQFLPTAGWPLTLSAAVDLMPTLHNQLAVATFDLYDTVALSPQRHTDWRSKLQLTLNPGASSRIWIGFQRQSLTPGSTDYEIWTQNGTPASLVRCPGSRQTLQQLSAGASWQF